MKNSVPLFLLLLVCSSANAAMYSCADESGAKVLRDWPCNEEKYSIRVTERIVSPVKRQSVGEIRAYNFGQIKVGMSVEEVYRILGEPERVNVTSSSGGKSEQMIYETGSTQEEIRMARIEGGLDTERNAADSERAITNMTRGRERELMLSGASSEQMALEQEVLAQMGDEIRANARKNRMHSIVNKEGKLASNPGYIYVTNGKVVSIQQTRQ